ALYGLFALPLLLIPYLMRRKPRRYIFSSLYMFTAPGINPSARPLKRLRLPLIFFLQLLLLALMVLALGEPVFTTRPAKVAIVLDNSASMQAMEGGKSRFTLAQEKAAGIFAELGLGATLDIYLTAPRLERFGRQSFSPAEAARALRGLKPLDVGEAPLDYGNALAVLAREQQYDRVYLLTDRPAQGQGGAARVVTVGRAQPNLALTGLSVHPVSLAESRLDASAEVANFSDKEARVQLTLRGGGAPLGRREIAIKAGARASASFEGLGTHPYYEAEIQTGDALALDDRRFAVASATKTLRILAVSPRPQQLTSLRAIRGVELDIVAPDDYEKTDRSRYGLEIFHFAAPTVLPRNPTLFILPPEQNDLVEFVSAAANPAVSGWRDGHRITRYVNFSLFRPRYARAFKPREPGDSVIRSAQGPLVYAITKQGVSYLVLGFDPLPYLGQENLPMSIFTLNVLDWFFAFSGERGSATGELISFRGAQPGDRIITPAGEQFPLQRGTNAFAGTAHQGIYQVLRGNEKHLLAVNLRDVDESDLRQATPIVFKAESDPRTGTSVLLPFWPYFLLAALLLLLLEWFIKPPMTRSGGISDLRPTQAA
ncbi:MAG TPA: VWA domain-containing protein, partial [Candidatus Binatia bacterium]|nr:VWA domain-containing protein [Candidatus Binatia bacterium]